MQLYLLFHYKDTDCFEKPLLKYVVFLINFNILMWNNVTLYKLGLLLHKYGSGLNKSTSQ